MYRVSEDTNWSKNTISGALTTAILSSDSPQDGRKLEGHTVRRENPNLNMAPVVPHKAVAEVSKIGNLKERLSVVMHGWQSKATDGSKGGGSVGLSICLSICLSD